MNNNRGKSIIKWTLFILYIALMIYFMFFAEMFGRTPSDEYRYNLMPFKEIIRFIKYSSTLGIRTVMINLVGNVVVFIPFGMALVSISRRKLGFFAVTLYSASLSISIELIQHLTRVGSCDVDDIILNTIGGMIGYLLYIIIRGRGKKQNETV